MNILIINAGSSSLKYQLMDPDTGNVAAKGLCERIYIDGRLTHKVGDSKVVKDIAMPSHSEAIQAVLSILVDPVHGVIKSVDEIDAVGHRVLHGGMEFFSVHASSPPSSGCRGYSQSRQVGHRHRFHRRP